MSEGLKRAEIDKHVARIKRMDFYDRLEEIRDIIDTVENRAMAVDGPVSNTRHEMTDKELQNIYLLAGGTIHGG